MAANFAFLTWPQMAVCTVVGILVLWPLLYVWYDKIRRDEP